MKPEAPEFPAGSFALPADLSRDSRRVWIDEIADLPVQLGQSVDGLSKEQLDKRYRNWTIRQIVHHIADSHANCYVRFKLALTEDHPTIKPYDESLWSDLPESRTGCIQPSLQMIDGLHARWTQLLASLTDEDFDRTFFHPESQATVSLKSALPYYAWHGRHHLGQINWLRDSEPVSVR